MRVLFTVFIIFKLMLANSQTFTGTLGPVTSAICNAGCNASTNSPFCTTCGSNQTGNCTEYAVTQVVSVPAGSTISITLTNANCGFSGEFDTGDEFTFLANGTLTLVAGTGVDGESTTKCYDNPSSNAINVTFGYRANRRDEYANYEYTISSGTGTGCLVLPVKFSKFEVSNTSKMSNLYFSSASETNNDYFTIERSSDGVDFEAIGEIKGAGNSSSELHYAFVDKNPLPGINYYRIKQTDFDGKYSYTDIKSVRHNNGQITVTPKRTDGRLQITSTQDTYDVVMYSTAGQEVYRSNGLSGDQTLSIESLEAGIYFIKILDQTFKIVKY